MVCIRVQWGWDKKIFCETHPRCEPPKPNPLIKCELNRFMQIEGNFFKIDGDLFGQIYLTVLHTKLVNPGVGHVPPIAHVCLARRPWRHRACRLTRSMSATKLRSQKLQLNNRVRRIRKKRRNQLPNQINIFKNFCQNFEKIKKIKPEKSDFH